jgi:hypothetical protein
MRHLGVVAGRIVDGTTRDHRRMRFGLLVTVALLAAWLVGGWL